MLSEFIRAAMRRATYEILPEDKTYYGEIPGLQGVWANADTLEACVTNCRMPSKTRCSTAYRGVFGYLSLTESS